MSTLDNYTTATRPAAASNTGLCIFNTDNDSIEVSDGTSYLSYASDGFTVGPSTHSADFDGTNDRVEIGNATVLNGVSAFSLSCWIKSSATVTSTFDLFSSGDGFTNGIFLYLTPTGLDFGVGGGGSDWDGIRYGTSLTDGTWKHLAFTFNSSTFAFYLNGSLTSVSQIGSSTISSTVSTAGNGSHIASRVDDTREYAGYMDDFAIFNAALSANEALNIKAHSIYPTTIEHLYKFDNNYNDSIGALNGTAQGDPQFQSSVVRP